MADIKWIKLDVGIFADEKIKVVMSMPEGKNLVIIWLKILCLAGRINNSGVLMVNSTIPYTVEMLSAVFDESESIMRLAIDTFQRLGMIDQFNGALLLPNWEKHQSEDRLKEIQKKNAARVARHREKQRLQAGNVTDTLQKRLCNAIEQEQEQEQDIEQELNKGNDGAKAPKPRGGNKTAIEKRFNDLWALYPRKQGRADALKAYERAVKAGVTDETIKQGIENYVKHIAETKTEPKYVKQGSTFFSKQAWADDYKVSTPPPTEKVYEEFTGW
jgi:predicted phage replisome organizer